MLPKLIVLDADGVLWRGTEVVPGAPGFIRRAREAGLRCCLMSNNAGPSRSDYARKCSQLGLDLAEEDIFSVNYIAGPFLARTQPGDRILVLGSPQLLESIAACCPAESASSWLAAHGINEAQGGLSQLSLLAQADFDVVFVGIDFSQSYLRLALACSVLQRGAKLIASNEDLTFPFERGLMMPGNGSFVELLARVSGTLPEFIGKPNLHMLEQIEIETAVSRSEMLLIGDRLDTDIALARRANMAACLVLTGVTAAADAPQPDSMLRIAANLNELGAELFGR